MVLLEDVVSGQILRCDVIVDVIYALNITTTTRELFIEEAPEKFEVRAFDEQGIYKFCLSHKFLSLEI